MKGCSECEYHKKLAQLWRDEAYKLGGHELPRGWVELTKEEYDDIYKSNKDSVYDAMMVVATYLKRKNV